MNNQLFTLDLTLTIQAPFLIQGSEPAGIGLDAVVQRNADKKPIIPGTLLVGKIKEVWKANAFTVDAAKWFGAQAENTNENNFDPKPGHLVETDLTLTTVLSDASNSIVHRVSLDAHTGSAKPGHLLMIEQPWAVGELVTFEGQWFVITTQPEAEKLAKLLEQTIAWIGQLGAQASVGFGKITAVKVSAKAKVQAAKPTRQNRIYYRMTSLFPVLVPKVGGAYDTLFEGGEVVPGAAIKAALAMTMNATNNKLLRSFIGNGFDDVTCSHAFPIKEFAVAEKAEKQLPQLVRHSQLPLSIVKVTTELTDAKGSMDTFYDVAHLDQPHLIDHNVPVFQIDWKDAHWDKLEELAPALAAGAIKQHLRVRTKMKDGTSEEAALFSHESVSADFGWYGFIDVSNVKTDVATQVQNALANTVLFLGKLKTPVDFEVLNEPAAAWKQAWTNPSVLDALAVGSMVTVSLNTEALLNPLKEINNDDLGSLEASYKNYWASVSNTGLELSHFFAEQQLAGGVFAANYRQTSLGQYRPWFVTKAGSTFVLKIKNTDGLKLLKQWALTGLPLSDAVKGYYGKSWKENPYGPENGYGEILINPQLGLKKLSPQQCELIEEFKAEGA
jgi:hypothetical protein